MFAVLAGCDYTRGVAQFLPRRALHPSAGHDSCGPLQSDAAAGREPGPEAQFPVCETVDPVWEPEDSADNLDWAGAEEPGPGWGTEGLEGGETLGSGMICETSVAPVSGASGSTHKQLDSEVSDGGCPRLGMKSSAGASGVVVGLAKPLFSITVTVTWGDDAQKQQYIAHVRAQCGALPSDMGWQEGAYRISC